MTRASDACDRLAETRGQLRLAIRAELGPVKPIVGSPATGWFGKLWGHMKSSPAVRPLAQGVDEWAARSPLPVAARIAVNALDATLRPMAQRHPWRLVVGAFVLGGAFAWSRPGRRVVSPTLVAAVLPQLLATMTGSVPRSAWITLAGALLNRKRAANAA